MKHGIFTTLLAICLFMVGITANAQVKALNDLRKTPGVSYVYISKFMLDLVGGSSSNIDIGKGKSSDKVNINSLKGKIGGIQIISTETESALSTVKETISNLISKEKYETMMELDEDEESCVIYFKQGKEQSVILMQNEGDNELSIIAISGTFTEQDIKENLLK